VRLDLRGDPRVRWAVQAVPALSADADGETLSPGGLVRFGALAERTLILTAIPAQPGKGVYDPEEHLEGRMRYELRLSLEAAPTTGGLVGHLDE